MLFFFSSRRRHTRLQGDWSSDVCSSDLVLRHDRLELVVDDVDRIKLAAQEVFDETLGDLTRGLERKRLIDVQRLAEIGRASCREREERGGVGVGEGRERGEVDGRARLIK